MNSWRATAARGFREVCCRPKQLWSSIRPTPRQSGSEESLAIPLETLWKNCVFDLCGVEDFYRKTYSVVVTSTKEERVAWLKDVTETVNRYFSNQVER